VAIFKRNLLWLLFLGVAIAAQGQEVFRLEVLPLNEQVELSSLDYKAELVDSLRVVRELRKVIQSLHAEAYLETTLDRVECEGQGVEAYLWVGPRVR